MPCNLPCSLANPPNSARPTSLEYLGSAQRPIEIQTARDMSPERPGPLIYLSLITSVDTLKRSSKDERGLDVDVTSYRMRLDFAPGTGTRSTSQNICNLISDLITSRYDTKLLTGYNPKDPSNCEICHQHPAGIRTETGKLHTVLDERHFRVLA